MPEDPAAPLAGTDDQVAKLAQDADSGPWLTVDEVAARLQLTPAAVRAQLSGGVLAGERVPKGRRLVWRVRAGAVPVDLRPQSDGDLEEVSPLTQAAAGTQPSATAQGGTPIVISSVNASIPSAPPPKKAGTDQPIAADQVDRVDPSSATVDLSGEVGLRLELARAKAERDAFKAALRALLSGLPD